MKRIGFKMIEKGMQAAIGWRLVRLREAPEVAGRGAEWFSKRWGIPKEEYQKSMAQCVEKQAGIPQWYLVMEGEQILAGAGVIANDFHDRTDLSPNVCALYVQEGHRKRGIARWLLEEICADMSRLGWKRLYLVTQHTGFYEKCCWKYIAMAQDEDKEMMRVYASPTQELGCVAGR